MITIHEEREKERRAEADRERKRDLAEAKQLTEIVARIVHNCNDETDISPAWVATQAMKEVGATTRFQRDYPLMYKAGHLEFRQLTRGVCRQKWERDDEDEAQHELFPGLQKRYPIAKQKGDEPVYRLLEHLSHEDRVFNINRLRKEASKKLEHARALEAYDRQLMNAPEGLVS